MTYMFLSVFATGVICSFLEGPCQANITLDLILKEKYVAMFLHPESWNDARRFATSMKT